MFLIYSLNFEGPGKKFLYSGPQRKPAFDEQEDNGNITWNRANHSGVLRSDTNGETVFSKASGRLNGTVFIFCCNCDLRLL